MLYFGWLAIRHKIIATVAKIVLWSVHHLIRLTKSWPFRLLAGLALTCLLSLHPRRTVGVCVFFFHVGSLWQKLQKNKFKLLANLHLFNALNANIFQFICY